MKSIVLTFAALFMFNFSLIAQVATAKKMEKAKASMIQTLQSEHEELIASTLVNVIQLAKRQGVENVQDLKVEIAKMSFSSNSPVLRYKAYLTLEALNNNELLNQLPEFDIEQADSVFNVIQQRMQVYAQQL